MAVSARYYGLFFKSAFSKLIDLNTDSVKVALYNSSLTPDQDAHQFWDAAPYTSNQITGSGYTAGGITLTGVTLTYTGATNTLAWDGNDIAWTSATFTGARYAIVYDATPVSNKPLIMFIDFGEDKSPSNGTLSIAWDASGLGYVTVV